MEIQTLLLLLVAPVLFLLWQVKMSAMKNTHEHNTRPILIAEKSRDVDNSSEAITRLRNNLIS